MNISKDKVVVLHYTLTDNAGQVLDSSQGKDPLAYIHGSGGIIPGLEKALENKTAGDAVQVTVPPAEAYGEKDESLIQAVPRKLFGDAAKLRAGMQFQANTQAGPRLMTIIAFQADEVVVDANHQLAGVTLNFDVKILDVRDATAEELEHGHVHGPGGHHHH